METVDLDELFRDPLITWFINCLDNTDSLTCYEDLVNGELLHKVFLKIHPAPWFDDILTADGSAITRVNNLHITLKNILQFYEEELNHLILKLPNIIKIAEDPVLHIKDMKLLLLLLLGCVVQCPNKANFITKIMELDVYTQHAIMEYIKQIEEQNDFVLSIENFKSVDNNELFSKIKDVVIERNIYFEKWKNCVISEPETSEHSTSKKEKIKKCNQNCAFELANCKSKVRKQRQELDDQRDSLIECMEELQKSKNYIAKLKNDNQSLLAEVRNAKCYRDELDALQERAQLANRLEIEVENYKERLIDIGYYKTRVSELQEDNKLLVETREVLEEQVNTLTTKLKMVKDSEIELTQYRYLFNNLSSEHTEDVEKYVELFSEQQSRLNVINTANNLINSETDLITVDADKSLVMNTSLSEQLMNSDMSRVLKLELENRRLQTSLDSFKENSMHENLKLVGELEKEKKKLSANIDTLNKKIDSLTCKNEELEMIYKQMLKDNQKLQNNIENQRLIFEKQRKEFEWQAKSKCSDLESKIDILESKKNAAQKIIREYRTTIEKTESSLKISKDKTDELTIQINELHLEVDYANAQIEQLQEIRSEKEESLQKQTQNLSKEKLKIHQLNKVLQKFELSVDKLLTLSFDEIWKMMLNNETKIMRNLKNQFTNDNLQSKGTLNQSEYKELLSINAELIGCTVALESEITTFKTKQTVLEDINSQLVTEREKFMLELAARKSSYHKLCREQDILRTSLEQLRNQYDNQFKNQENTKTILRQVRSENNILHESLNSLQTENEKLRRNQSNGAYSVEKYEQLNKEYINLKEDFVKLLSDNQKLNNIYNILKEDHDRIQTKMNGIIQKRKEEQDKLKTKEEKYSNLETEFIKLNQRYELLSQFNNNLDQDRQSLMEHTSQMFDQYHQLFTQSTEDKEHFHKAEKEFTHEIHRLCRQNHLLEEKIMEFYKKMENCPTKKKNKLFRDNFIRKVQKASSDLFNRSRQSSQDSSSKDTSPTNEIETSENEYEMFDFSESVQSSTLNTSIKSSSINISLDKNQTKSRRTVAYVNEIFSSHIPDETNLSQESTENKQLSMIPVICNDHHSTLIRNNSPIAIIKQNKDNNELDKNVSNNQGHKNQKGKEKWEEIGCV